MSWLLCLAHHAQGNEVRTHGNYLRAARRGMSQTPSGTASPTSEVVRSRRYASHLFAEAMRQAKVKPELRSQLLRHATASMTGSYGAGHDPKAAAEAVASVSFDGLKIG